VTEMTPPVPSSPGGPPPVGSHVAWGGGAAGTPVATPAVRETKRDIDGCAAAAEATAAATAAALTAAGVRERGSRVRQQQGVGVATVRVAKRVALVVEGERA